MNRRLLVIVAVAAVVALLVGADVGRNLLSSSTPAPRAEIIRFQDASAKVSIAYPATWTRLPQRPQDPGLALLVAADDSTSLLMRVSASGLDTAVTTQTLPIARRYTDGLVSEDTRAKQIVAPTAVVLGGLPGWRYRYTFDSGATAGAHDHYFLFKGTQLIQLVFQAVPASRLPSLAPVFDGIAASFRGRDT